ncbi:Gamma-butyrobetaine dioxygenase [Branchiostoma belcheri]|nr:Gamma-butyrobetaine dioxygenase [Branchiostoma belcheri]
MALSVLLRRRVAVREITSKYSRAIGASFSSGYRLGMPEYMPTGPETLPSQVGHTCTRTTKQQPKAIHFSRARFPPQVVVTRRFTTSSERRKGHESAVMGKAALNEAARMVEVEWSDGGVSRFPYVWLRDNCQCPQCFNPDSLSRRVLMNDLDVNVSPVRVELQAKGSLLSVEWPQGHQSQYDCQWLRERCFSTQALSERERDWQRKTQLWGAELAHNLPKADFPAILRDDRALHDFLVVLDSVGLVLVQNVPCDVGQVERLANRVAFLKPTSYGKEFEVVNKPKPNDLAYTTVKIGLHTDLNYYSYRPGVQMLHCIEQTKGEGGDNSLTDGINAAYQLQEENPDAFRLLTTLKVNFYCTGVDLYNLNDQGEVQSVSFSDQARDSILDLPTDQVQPFYDALKAFDTIMYLPRNCLRFKMAAGEMIVFDNTRTLHGRSAYSLQSARHLQGGYLDWDEIYSRMRVLKVDLGIKD